MGSDKLQEGPLLSRANSNFMPPPPPSPFHPSPTTHTHTHTQTLEWVRKRARKFSVYYREIGSVCTEKWGREDVAPWVLLCLLCSCCGCCCLWADRRDVDPEHEGSEYIIVSCWECTVHIGLRDGPKGQARASQVGPPAPADQPQGAHGPSKVCKQGKQKINK